MATTYDTPILIKQGDKVLKYENKNFKDDNGHAAEVWTSDPVEFINCTFTSKGGDGVKTAGYTSITAKGCKFYNIYDDAGNQKGRAVNNYRPRNFVLEHCYWEENSGVLLDHTDDTTLAGVIKILNCQAKNATKAKRDGSNGGSHCQFIQLSNINTVNGYKSVEIGWIEGINEYGKSWIEDGISITACKATKQNPIRIHDVFIKGVYAPVGATSFSGSGLTIENGSANILVENAQLVSCMNACANIAGGSNNTITKSRFISASLLPDGSKTQLFWAGCCIFNSDGTPDSEFATNSIKGNTIGYNRWNDAGNAFPVAGRHDEMNIRKSVTGRANDNWMLPNENLYLNGTITAETEANEYKSWQKKLKDNNQYVGTEVVLTTPLSVTLKEGTTLSLNSVNPIDSNGNAANYKKGSINYATSDQLLAKIVEDVNDEKLFSIVAAKAGTTTGTATSLSTANKEVTKTFTIVIESNEPEAVDMVITFNNK